MKNIFKALADFQQEVPVIHKGTQGFGYSYADLSAIFQVINPYMKKHKLGFTQLVGKNTIKTKIFHTESGEEIETETDIPQGVTLKGMNEFQVLGSAITYIRRYALGSALGLVTDKDLDACGIQDQPKEQAKQQPKQQSEKSKIDIWLNATQFEEIKGKTKADIKKYLDYYDGKTPQKDGKVYGMKKEFKEALEKLI